MTSLVTLQALSNDILLTEKIKSKTFVFKKKKTRVALLDHDKNMKNMKNVYKIRLQRDFLKLATNGQSERGIWGNMDRCQNLQPNPFVKRRQ